MLQRISFEVERREIVGTVHLPEGEPSGRALVLHGYGGDPAQPHIVSTCDALARNGIAALRFPYRNHEPPRMTVDSGFADATAALRLLRAHPQVRGESAVIGFSFGGSLAAMLAGRDAKIRAAVLCAAPAAFKDDDRALKDVARTKAAVLLLWGSRDNHVPFANAERFAEALALKKVTHETRTIEGGDHDFAPAGPREAMARAVGAWVRERLAVS